MIEHTEKKTSNQIGDQKYTNIEAISPSKLPRQWCRFRWKNGDANNCINVRHSNFSFRYIIGWRPLYSISAAAWRMACEIETKQIITKMRNFFYREEFMLIGMFLLSIDTHISTANAWQQTRGHHIQWKAKLVGTLENKGFDLCVI